MLRKWISPMAVVEFLNELLVIDRDMVEQAVMTKVRCSEQAYNHPSVQSRKCGSTYETSMLGILNGMFGTVPSGVYQGWGIIRAEVDSETKRLLRFSLVED